MAKPVLVVEDDPDIQLNLQMLLEDEGYEVIQAMDGQAGLDVLAEQGARVGVVLLDLMMPRMSGDRFLEVLSAQHDGRPFSPPIVLLSASCEAAPLAKRYGVDLVTKPIDIDALLALLARYTA